MSVTMIDPATGERISLPTSDLPNGSVLHRALPDGTEFEVRDIDPRLLRVDYEYQRELRKQRVRAYAREWSYVKAAMLMVSARGEDDYVVIDGQHRMAAALEAAVPEVPCLVLYGLSRRDEAALFNALSTQRVGLTARQRFKARLVAGDPVCQSILQAALECGYRLHLSAGTSREPNVIDAVAHLEIVYRRGLDVRPKGKHLEPVHEEEGRAAVRRVLDTISACWYGQRDAKMGVVIEALGIFWQYHAVDVDLAHLAEKLRLVPVRELLRTSYGNRQAAGGSEILWFAHSLVERYNQRKTTRRIPARMPLPTSRLERSGYDDAEAT